jgi:hypothetical protein
MMLTSASFTVAISLPPTDISDRLLRLCARVQEQLKALPDVVNMPIADGPRHAVAVAVGIQTYFLVSDTEPDRTPHPHKALDPTACCTASSLDLGRGRDR